MIILIPTKKIMIKNLSEENEKKLDPKQLKITGKENNMTKHAELPVWFKSKNDFYEAAKLINDIKGDINNVKVSLENKKVNNDLVSLMIVIINNKEKRKVSLKE